MDGMKQQALVAAAVVALAVLAGCTSPSTGGTGDTGYASASLSKRYTSSQHGFSMSYPEDWAVAENVPDTAVVISGPAVNDFSPSVVVTVAASVPQSLEEVNRSTQQWYKELSADYQMLSSDELLVNGLKAYRTTGTYSLVKYTQATVVRGNKAYVLTFVALKGDYDRHAATFNAMLNSFRV